MTSENQAGAGPLRLDLSVTMTRKKVIRLVFLGQQFPIFWLLGVVGHGFLLCLGVFDGIFHEK